MAVAAAAVTDEAGTAHVARELAATLRPGDVVHLIGDLGTGKTTFVRHAAAALGVSEPVTSPTFAVAHRKHDGHLSGGGGHRLGVSGKEARRGGREVA